MTFKIGDTVRIKKTAKIMNWETADKQIGETGTVVNVTNFGNPEIKTSYSDVFLWHKSEVEYYDQNREEMLDIENSL